MCAHVCAATTALHLEAMIKIKTVRSLVLDQHLHFAHQVSGQGQNLLDVVVLSHFWKTKKQKKYN